MIQAEIFLLQRGFLNVPQLDFENWKERGRALSNVLYENSNIVGFYAKNKATFLLKIFHSIIKFHDPKEP